MIEPREGGAIRAAGRIALGTHNARAKIDRLDARGLARLLAAGRLDEVWVPDEPTWVRRHAGVTSSLIGATRRRSVGAGADKSPDALRATTAVPPSSPPGEQTEP